MLLQLMSEIGWAKIVTESVVEEKGVCLGDDKKHLILTAVTYVIHSHLLSLCIFVVVP